MAPRKSKSKRRSRSNRSLKRKSRRKSKSPVRIRLRSEHALGKFGYEMKANAETRQKSLKKAVKEYGYGIVMKRVNVLYIFNKNRNPKLAAKATADKKWLRKTYRD